MLRDFFLILFLLPYGNAILISIIIAYLPVYTTKTKIIRSEWFELFTSVWQSS